MIDERDRLERAARRFTPEPGIVDRVQERRRRKHRNRRIGSAVVALGVCAAVAGIVIASATHGSAPTPGGSEPAPSSSASSTAPVATPMHNGPLDVFGLGIGLHEAAGTIRVFGANGVGELVVSCRTSCTNVPAAAWSPDGKRLAYSASCAGGCGSAGEPSHGIRVLDVATGDDRVVLRGDALAPLAWSPDGSRLAYVTYGRLTPNGWVWNKDLSWSLMVVGADGSTPVEVWRGEGRPGTLPESLSWSPDGSRIAYASDGKIFVLALDGSRETQIATGTNVAWSPDGRTIAYLAGCDVRLVTPDGGSDLSLFDLTTAGPDAASCHGGLGLAWSPDGAELAAMVERNVTAPTIPTTLGVFVVAANGSEARLLGQWTRENGIEGIAWQPVPGHDHGAVRPRAGSGT
jgi:dipeptidyl aminopeptidase/acylaminoacyl peptidase